MLSVCVALLAALLILAPATEQQLIPLSDEGGSGDLPRTSISRLPSISRQPSILRPSVADDDSSGALPLSDTSVDDDDGSGSAAVTMATTRAAAIVSSTTTPRGGSTVGRSTSGPQDRPGSEPFIDIDATSAMPMRPAASSKTSGPAHHHHHALPTTRQPQSTLWLNNAVPNVPTVLPAVDEAREEASNSIAGAGFAVAQSRMGPKPDQHGLHPGLLAAVIGGGVVGLLCAILLVMFVVYRLRKKDEGGYTTVDAKPRLNTYTKASSREFYA